MSLEHLVAGKCKKVLRNKTNQNLIGLCQQGIESTDGAFSKQSRENLSNKINKVTLDYNLRNKVNIHQSILT